MPTERPWPSSPRFRTIGIAVTFAILTAVFVGLGMWLEQPLVAALPFFVAVPVECLFFWVRRWPGCGERLADRREFVGESTRYRMLARCEQCAIDWDRGVGGDTKFDE